jgi:hypothetical protein
LVLRELSKGKLVPMMVNIVVQNFLVSEQMNFHQHNEF